MPYEIYENYIFSHGLWLEPEKCLKVFKNASAPDIF